jgi:hypothetical protein
MSVSNENVKETYSGNGVTIYWPITFEYADPNHIAVYLTDDDGVTGDKLESDYTVDEENERVIYPDPLNEELILPEGWKITLKRETPLVQNYQPSTQNFNPADIEPALDKTMMAIAEIKEENGRTIKANITENGVDYTLPSPAQGLVVGWDLTDGTRLVNYTNPGAAAAEAEAFAAEAAGSATTAAEAEEAIRGIVYHGWVSGLTAVYVSATSIKIEGLDVTDRIQQGTKIRYKQGVEYKYDFVSEVSFATDSTLTLLGGSTVEDEAITEFWFSNIANPIGWPFGVDYIQGSNENGAWKKWVDGTKECEGKIALNNINISSTSGSVYRSDPFKITWPCEFSSPPKAYYEINSSGSGLLWLSTKSNISTIESNNLHIVCSKSVTERSFEIVFRVKGE